MGMKKGNSDSFESGMYSSAQNPFAEADSDNFFLTGEMNSMPPEPSRRLNDYDSNLLEADAYKEVSDELFKIEYKIARLEEELKEIDYRIQSARDIYDYDQIEILSNRKQLLKKEYASLIKIYNDMSLSAKLSDGILNLFGGNRKTIGNTEKNHLPHRLKALNEGCKFILDSILAKMPKKFSSVFELKKSLSKLESINKNVDELIGMNIPYGENVDKYDQLSKYIIRANSIQNNISKIIK